MIPLQRIITIDVSCFVFQFSHAFITWSLILIVPNQCCWMSKLNKRSKGKRTFDCSFFRSWLITGFHRIGNSLLRNIMIVFLQLKSKAIIILHWSFLMYRDFELELSSTSPSCINSQSIWSSNNDFLEKISPSWLDNNVECDLVNYSWQDRFIWRRWMP